MSLTIRNEKKAPEVAALVRRAWNAMSPHWQKAAGRTIVVVLPHAFDKEPLLKNFIKGVRKECAALGMPGAIRDFLETSEVIVYTPPKRQVTIFARTSRSMGAYYFQEEFYNTLAEILWSKRREIRKFTAENATHLNERGHRVVFRDCFSRFFLNPKWLRKAREEAWRYMRGLDKVIKSTVKP